MRVRSKGTSLVMIPISRNKQIDGGLFVEESRSIRTLDLLGVAKTKVFEGEMTTLSQIKEN